MTFGVMFHHFHNKYHSKSQGSISSNQLTKIIKYLRKKYILLNAKDYLEKIKNKNIKSNNANIVWAKHPSRIHQNNMCICTLCNSPTPEGEIKRWGKCSFCWRKINN